MNPKMQTRHRDRQKGAVLVLALVFLLLLTIVGVVASRRSTLELQMAGNFQTRLEYYEYARSVMDAFKAQTNLLPPPITVGYTRCSSSAARPVDVAACNETSLPTINTGGVVPAGVTVDTSSTYAGMAALAYQSEDTATSQGLLQTYRIATRVSRTDSKGADVKLEVGLVRLEPE